MASTLFQDRSDSLPSRPHPLMSELDDHICRLRACEATSTSSTSITHKLSGLQDLYDGVNKLLRLPITQQALAHNQRWVDDLLDGSLRLLDVCSAAKDALLQTKEYTLELQSTIRRRQGGSENAIATGVRKYLTSRKMAKKAIQKALNNLKGSSDSKFSIESTENNEIATLVSMLKEVQRVTLAVLKSFMSFISGTKPQSKTNNWSLVSKLMLHKRIASEEEEAVPNEFAMADAALESLVGYSKYDNMENVQSQLKNLEESIQDLEEGTHSLFRRMIKTRVSLLNIFN